MPHSVPETVTGDRSLTRRPSCWMTLGCVVLLMLFSGCSKLTLPRLTHESPEDPPQAHAPQNQSAALDGQRSAQHQRTSPDLDFRVLIEDENRSQSLEPGEQLSVRVELHNKGAGVAQGVMVEMAGTPSFVQRFATPMLVGDMQPEERKQVLLAATLPESEKAAPGGSVEIIVYVTEAGGFSPPDHKRVLVPLSRDEPQKDAALPPAEEPAIEPLPESTEQPAISAVVVGIERYREPQIPSLPYAQRDAHAVADSLRAHAGVAEANLRLLTDDRAMRSDLQEALDHWVPAQASDKALVVVYLVGQGSYNPKTGEVALIPYEGDGDTREQLYSLTHLYRVASGLPCPVVIVADLSFEGPGVNGRADAGLLDAIPHDHASNTVLISATEAPRRSIRLDGQAHGAFAASFVKALEGAADRNGDRWVTVEELFTYVERAAAAADGRVASGQSGPQPVMVPSIKPGHPLSRLPLSQVDLESR